MVLRDAVQAPCGHRHCKTCLDDFIRSSSGRICPACPEGAGGDERQVFPDKGMRKEIHTLRVVCDQDGCGWRGCLRDYQENHEKSCPLRQSTIPESELRARSDRDTESGEQRLFTGTLKQSDSQKQSAVPEYLMQEEKELTRAAERATTSILDGVYNETHVADHPKTNYLCSYGIHGTTPDWQIKDLQDFARIDRNSKDADYSIKKKFPPPTNFGLSQFPKNNDERFKCETCKLVLRDPEKAPCGHRHCKSCLDDFIRSGGGRRCPACPEGAEGGESQKTQGTNGKFKMLKENWTKIEDDLDSLSYIFEKNVLDKDDPDVIGKDRCHELLKRVSPSPGTVDDMNTAMEAVDIVRHFEKVGSDDSSPLVLSEDSEDELQQGELSDRTKDRTFSPGGKNKDKNELVPIPSKMYIQKFLMDSNGGYVHLKEVGVTLVVSEGSLPEGTVTEMHLGISWRPGDNPHLGDKQTRTSPIVVCGPHDLIFQKPVYLSFPHCIPNVDDAKTEIKFWTSKTDLLGTCKWITHENDPVVIYSQTRCTVALWNLCKYTTSSTKKEMLAAGFGNFDPKTDLLSVVVKCIRNTMDEIMGLDFWAKRYGLKQIVPDGIFKLYICPHSKGDQSEGNFDKVVCEENHDVLVTLKDYQGWIPFHGEDKKTLYYSKMNDDQKPHCLFSFNPEPTAPCPKIFTSKILVAQQGYEGEAAQLSSVELEVCHPLHEITKVADTEQSHPDAKLYWGSQSQQTPVSMQHLSVMNPVVSHQAQEGLPATGISETLQQQSVMNPLAFMTQEGLTASGISETLQRLSVMNPVVSHQAQEGLPSTGISETLQQQSVMNPLVSHETQVPSAAGFSEPLQQHQQKFQQQQSHLQHQQHQIAHPQQQQLPDTRVLPPNVQINNITQTIVHQNGDQGLIVDAPHASVHVFHKFLPFEVKANLEGILKNPQVWRAVVRELQLRDYCPIKPVEFVFCHLQSSFQQLLYLLRKVRNTVNDTVKPSEIKDLIDEVEKARRRQVEYDNLRKNLSFMVNDGFEIKRLLDFLYSKFIINTSDIEEINDQKTSSDKRSTLLHKVLNCPSDKEPVCHLQKWFAGEDRCDLAALLAVKTEDEQELPVQYMNGVLRPEGYQESHLAVSQRQEDAA